MVTKPLSPSDVQELAEEIVYLETKVRTDDGGDDDDDIACVIWYVSYVADSS